MMTRLSPVISIIMAVMFSLWVIWMWWPDQNIEKTKPQKPPQSVPAQPLKLPAPQALNAVLTLPSPPAPPKMSSPPIQKTAPVQVEKPAPKPVIKESQANPKKPQPRPKETVQSPIKPEKPIPQKKPEPKEQSSKQAAPPVPSIEITQLNAKEGRALLRVLEHGKGPMIEIAWPTRAHDRQRLHHTFKQCFGMENALMDVKGDLYRVHETSGKRWEINLDRFSGFLRAASGRLSGAEERAERQILTHHKGIYGGQMVRIFPRRVDASLIGGFHQMLGSGYQQARTIQASYRLEGEHVFVENILMDGASYPGRIKLVRFSRC